MNAHAHAMHNARAASTGPRDLCPFEDFDAFERARAERVTENIRAAGARRSVLLWNGDAAGLPYLLAHPSTREPGRDQLSWLDSDRRPAGHATYDTREDAIASASGRFVGGEAPHGHTGFRVVEDFPR